jgi:hypothetical protein
MKNPGLQMKDLLLFKIRQYHNRFDDAKTFAADILNTSGF